MASNRKPGKKSSLATRARHKKQLFLPMSRTEADRLALRFRMALLRAEQGTAESPDVRCLAETVMMVGLVADLEGSDVDDSDLSASEDCMRRRLACVENPDWRLSENEGRSLRAVINEHDRQLHQSRLQTLVKATERFERLLRSVDTLQFMFDARRIENRRQA